MRQIAWIILGLVIVASLALIFEATLFHSSQEQKRISLDGTWNCSLVLRENSCDFKDVENELNISLEVKAQDSTVTARAVGFAMEFFGPIGPDGFIVQNDYPFDCEDGTTVIAKRVLDFAAISESGARDLLWTIDSGCPRYPERCKNSWVGKAIRADSP